MSADVDAAVTRCPVCGELQHSPHIFCAAVNQPKPPAPTTWPRASQREDPCARQLAARRKAETLLEQLRGELDYLAGLPPEREVYRADDARFHAAAVRHLESLVFALAEVTQLRVAR